MAEVRNLPCRMERSHLQRLTHMPILRNLLELGRFERLQKRVAQVHLCGLRRLLGRYL